MQATSPKCTINGLSLYAKWLFLGSSAYYCWQACKWLADTSGLKERRGLPEGPSLLSTTHKGVEVGMRGLVLSLGVTLAMLLAYVGAASAVDDVGYRDFSFNATSVVAPTGEKPQSKLWFNDGTWWASMFNRTAEEYHIYRYDRATHTWSDTGTLIDERNNSKADTLWDGSHLYVATAGICTTCSPQSARLLRYSYDAQTKRYSLDPGFPVSGISNGGMEAIVLDKDTTGKLWVTYTQKRQVYVNRSLSTDQTWGTPFVLPVAGASNLNADDISAVVAFDSQIGIMWSNQRDSAMYFATHTDGDADDVWQASRTAIQGPNFADDHISLRSLQVDDVSGRVFAAVKTSLNDVPNPNPNAPLIFLMALGRDGNWTNHVFGRVGDNHTRPIVMIDQEHRDLYMFASAPCCDGGAIYYKKTALANISFPEGVGTPFVQSATDTRINNATSTKQNVNSTTGLMVLASDDTSRNYLHNIIDVGNVDTVAPTINTIAPTDGATDVAATSNAEVTFSEAMDSSTINGSTFTLVKQGTSQPVAAQVTYDPVSQKATLDPDAGLEADATYTATLKGGAGGVMDDAGNSLAEDKTWSFTTAAASPPDDTTPPETTIDSGPSDTITVDSATFEFSSSEPNSTFECSLDGGGFASCTSPKAYGGLSNGSHTFEVRATDAAGNSDATPASRTWTVDTTAPVVCTITGTANAETISGTSGDDVICAGGGIDTINGLGGNDTLKGEAGNDTLLGGVGNDTLDGGLGIADTASYSASLTAVTASLATNSATGEGSDTFLGVENLFGSSKADSLTGSTANNRLTGGVGPDTEQGGLGNDTIIGSAGADTLKGEDGDDTVNSKDNVSGNDSLDGGAGTDTAVTDATEQSIVNFP
jgi:Ca2+-binding RTX toxin-like protein